MSGESRPETYASRASALLGCDDVERRWALFHVPAFAVRTHELAFPVLGKRENCSEDFPALLAEEFILGHKHLLGECAPEILVRIRDWSNCSFGIRRRHFAHHASELITEGLRSVPATRDFGWRQKTRKRRRGLLLTRILVIINKTVRVCRHAHHVQRTLEDTKPRSKGRRPDSYQPGQRPRL